MYVPEGGLIMSVPEGELIIMSVPEGGLIIMSVPEGELTIMSVPGRGICARRRVSVLALTIFMSLLRLLKCALLKR